MVIAQQIAAEQAPPSRRGFAGTPDCATLSYPVMGRFTVHGGNELIVPSVREATAKSIAAIVIGTALAHLCHQRGLVPLHAATVLRNGRAIALAGSWGIGKSTLLDAFVRAGHRFMSDDLCAVELPSNAFPGRSAARSETQWCAADPGSLQAPNSKSATIPDQRCTADALHCVRKTNAVMALPCGPWIKLRDDILNERYAGAARFKAPGNKTWVDLAAQFQAEPAPLAAIFLIADGAHDDTICVERLTGVAAIAAAPLAVSRWRQAKASQGLAVLSERLMALFSRVPFYRLHRPRTLDRLGEVVAFLQRFAEERDIRRE